MHNRGDLSLLVLPGSRIASGFNIWFTRYLTPRMGWSYSDSKNGAVNCAPIILFPPLGLDHLLYLGRGAGGHNDEAIELHVACFMGLVYFLASRQEVLRIAPRRPTKMSDAAARAVIQTATRTQTPLTDAGLDGTGEVIQVWRVGVCSRSRARSRLVQMVCRTTISVLLRPALVLSNRLCWHLAHRPCTESRCSTGD